MWTTRTNECSIIWFAQLNEVIVAWKIILDSTIRHCLNLLEILHWVLILLYFRLINIFSLVLDQFLRKCIPHPEGIGVPLDNSLGIIWIQDRWWKYAVNWWERIFPFCLENDNLGDDRKWVLQSRFQQWVQNFQNQLSMLWNAVA